MPGYVHHTDHRFLRVQMAVPPKAMLQKVYGSSIKPGSHSRPPRLLVGGVQDVKVVNDFNMQLHSLMSESFVDEGYSLFGHAVRKVAERCLGVPKHGAPEWNMVYTEERARLSQEERQMALQAPDGRRPSFQSPARLYAGEPCPGSSLEAPYTGEAGRGWWYDGCLSCC